MKQYLLSMLICSNITQGTVKCFALLVSPNSYKLVPLPSVQEQDDDEEEEEETDEEEKENDEKLELEPDLHLEEDFELGDEDCEPHDEDLDIGQEDLEGLEPEEEEEESTKIKILRQIAEVASRLKEIIGNLIATAGKVVVTILLGFTGIYNQKLLAVYH